MPVRGTVGSVINTEMSHSPVPTNVQGQDLCMGYARLYFSLVKVAAVYCLATIWHRPMARWECNLHWGDQLPVPVHTSTLWPCLGEVSP